MTTKTLPPPLLDPPAIDATELEPLLGDRERVCGCTILRDGLLRRCDRLAEWVMSARCDMCEEAQSREVCDRCREKLLGGSLLYHEREYPGHTLRFTRVEPIR